jgi:CBS domain-containing protein
MPVSDVARRDVVTAHRDHSARELASLMREKNVGSVVVVNGDEPVGVVTDRDLALAVIDGGANPDTVTAVDVMSASPATVRASDGLFDAMETLRDHEVRRLPVVDEDGTLAGIVTLDDLVVLLAAELDDLADVIEAEFPT